MPAISILPPSRLFPWPTSPFATEVAVLSAGNVVEHDGAMRGVTWIANDDAPGSPRIVVVRRGAADAAEAPLRLAAHLLARLRAPSRAHAELSTRRHVCVESEEDAARLAPTLIGAGLAVSRLSFYAVDAAELARGGQLSLDPMVGDEAWREWALVERAILAESMAPRVPTEALLDRSVAFKRRQQRDSPPIRRYLGHDQAGAPVAMVGYAPFAGAAFGPAPGGVLVRLRDVAVLPHARRRGVGAALLRGVAARAIDECGARQVLICGAAEGVPAALYRRVGATPIDCCVAFSGELS